MTVKDFQAGDRLIRRCCDCLKRVFEGNGMFRIGGDELVVLCTGISEKEFYQKVEELKTELAAHDVSMAVGAAVNTLEASGKGSSTDGVRETDVSGQGRILSQYRAGPQKDLRMEISKAILKVYMLRISIRQFP